MVFQDSVAEVVVPTTVVSELDGTEGALELLAGALELLDEKREASEL